MMSLLFDVLSKVRKEGLMSIEGDIDKPEESALFSKYPMTMTKMLHLSSERTAIVAEVEIKQRRIAVMAVHLLAYNLQFVPIQDIRLWLRP